MPLGLFLFSIFLVVTCPRPPIFARPNILVTSFATQARACILSDHNIFYTPRGGRERRGNAPGAFLVSNEIRVIYCPTEDMIADIMTKGLAKLTFEKLRDLLAVSNIM